MRMRKDVWFQIAEERGEHLRGEIVQCRKNKQKAWQTRRVNRAGVEVTPPVEIDAAEGETYFAAYRKQVTGVERVPN
jgi:hypothetical protein